MNERRLSTSSLLSYDSPSVISSIGVQTNISKGSSCKAIKIVLAVISACLNVGLITWVIVLQRKDFIPLGPACPDSWIGYQGKCYYFSEEKRNWTSSQNFCMSYNSSLLTISCKKEKAFVMRFNGKNTAWIGLRREQGQPWKWTNGDNSTNFLFYSKQRFAPEHPWNALPEKLQIKSKLSTGSPTSFKLHM
uniref:C-type lectin domain-containing protein n=1 Tax=Varanus komodoensis TaxID=61221 RepID=A0A8D2KTN7_VARKO